MKQNSLFLLIVFLFCCQATYSQLNKGIWMAGGSGTFNSYNDVYKSETYNIDYDFKDFDISASVGYFVADKIALGLHPSFSSRKAKDNNVSGDEYISSRRVAIGPFCRYYLLSANRPVNIVSDVCYQYGAVDFGKNHKKGTINNFSLKAGPVIYFNTSVGLEVLLGYSAQKEEVKNDALGYKNKRRGFQVSVGFQIHLEKN